MDMSDRPHVAPTAEATPSRTDAAWLAAHWMPYTGNRDFIAAPRLLTSAKGAYYTDANGKQVFDGLSGLWCTGLGHGRDEITCAVAQQMATLDYSPAFQFGHPLSFELANWQAVDGLLTNFHLPRTTMLMMVAAMIGRERLMGAYAHAIESSYRFLSFVDAMLII